MITAGGVLLLGGLWLGVTALMARSELNQVRAEARTLSTLGEQLVGGTEHRRGSGTHAHGANQLNSGPVWALAAAPAINYTSALVAQTTKTISALPAPTWLSSIVPPTPARYTRSPTLTTP